VIIGGRCCILRAGEDEEEKPRVEISRTTRVNVDFSNLAFPRHTLALDGLQSRGKAGARHPRAHRRIIHICVKVTWIQMWNNLLSGRGNSGDNDVGPILLPPRDYDTVHRHRGNLAGIEFRRCLNQTIVGASTATDRGGTRSAASSGIGSDSAATPPPYSTHHPLGQRPSRPSRDSSSGE